MRARLQVGEVSCGRGGMGSKGRATEVKRTMAMEVRVGVQWAWGGLADELHLRFQRHRVAQESQDAANLQVADLSGAIALRRAARAELYTRMNFLILAQYVVEDYSWGVRAPLSSHCRLCTKEWANQSLVRNGQLQRGFSRMVWNATSIPSTSYGISYCLATQGSAQLALHAVSCNKIPFDNESNKPTFVSPIRSYKTKELVRMCRLQRGCSYTRRHATPTPGSS